jgi:hypothetical protein
MLAPVNLLAATILGQSLEIGARLLLFWLDVVAEKLRFVVVDVLSLMITKNILKKLTSFCIKRTACFSNSALIEIPKLEIKLVERLRRSRLKIWTDWRVLAFGTPGTGKSFWNEIACRR